MQRLSVKFTLRWDWVHYPALSTGLWESEQNFLSCRLESACKSLLAPFIGESSPQCQLVVNPVFDQICRVKRQRSYRKGKVVIFAYYENGESHMY